MRPTRQSNPGTRRRYSNGAVRFLMALDRSLEDPRNWLETPQKRAIDNALLFLMGGLVAIVVAAQIAIHYHLSISFFGA